MFINHTSHETRLLTIKKHSTPHHTIPYRKHQQQLTQTNTGDEIRTESVRVRKKASEKKTHTHIGLNIGFIAWIIPYLSSYHTNQHPNKNRKVKRCKLMSKRNPIWNVINVLLLSVFHSFVEHFRLHHIAWVKAGDTFSTNCEKKMFNSIGITKLHACWLFGRPV